MSQLFNNSLNRLSHLTGTYGYDYSYDTRGNITNNERFTLTYNRANQMTSANGVTYVYDGHNRRVKKSKSGDDYSVYSQGGQLMHRLTADGKRTDSIYLGKHIVAELDSTDSLPLEPKLYLTKSFASITGMPYSHQHQLRWSTHNVEQCSGIITRTKAGQDLGSVSISGISNIGMTFPGDGTVYFATLTCTGRSGAITRHSKFGGGYIF